MKAWNGQQIADAASAELLRANSASAANPGPTAIAIDSRALSPGELFVTIAGERVDSGQFAADVLSRGAWGVLTTPEWGAKLESDPSSGVILTASDPIAALGRLAQTWRQGLGAQVIAVTGSVGKTSTRDIIAAVLSPHRRVRASRRNYNTEIGLPIELLSTEADTEILVLELGMRGLGQIAELAAICQPDVGVITNIAPVHLEVLGSIENIACAKAELLQALPDGATAVIPANEPLLEPYLRPNVNVVTFGPGGDVHYANDSASSAACEKRTVVAGDESLEISFSFHQKHFLTNALAAIAVARAVGVTPSNHVDVTLTAMRSEEIAVANNILLINDCYNSNPLAVAAAVEDLAQRQTEGRRVALLGDMAELGPQEQEFHRAVGRDLQSKDIDVLISVGPLAALIAEEFDGEAYLVANASEAAGLLPEVVEPGDVVLIKGSRGVGLEVVSEALLSAIGEPQANLEQGGS